jgi:transcriptional regulator with XRE-family HTH domain
MKSGHSLYSRSMAARIERGVREVQPRTIRKLAEALGVEPRELVK